MMDRLMERWADFPTSILIALAYSPQATTPTEQGLFAEAHPPPTPRGSRKKYLCEHLLERAVGYTGEGRSAGALMGDLANLRAEAMQQEENLFFAEEKQQRLKQRQACCTDEVIGG